MGQPLLIEIRENIAASNLSGERIKICRGARYFITGKEHAGRAPPGAQEADMVCILLSCDMPLVIRKTREFNLLLGSCYFNGIMNGEVIKDDTDRRSHFMFATDPGAGIKGDCAKRITK